jgi:hypothetical protein
VDGHVQFCTITGRFASCSRPERSARARSARSNSSRKSPVFVDHAPQYAPLLAHLSDVLLNGDRRCPTLRRAISRDVTCPQHRGSRGARWVLARQPRHRRGLQLAGCMGHEAQPVPRTQMVTRISNQRVCRQRRTNRDLWSAARGLRRLPLRRSPDGARMSITAEPFRLISRITG